ncbi:MAG: transposase [Pseudomonadota bacterium]
MRSCIAVGDALCPIDIAQTPFKPKVYSMPMVRPLRIEFPGALYHVTARGNRRDRIYVDNFDRTLWLDILASVCARFRFSVHAYCLMPNHYHLLLETPRAQLSVGMRQLNGAYSQAFNRRHRLVGHVFQGRYAAVLCEKESYLKELARYIVLNPVRAHMVNSIDDWPWSSHAYMMGREPTPPWLHARYLLSHFDDDIEKARRTYLAFTLDGMNARRPLDEVRHQMFLGEIPEARDRKPSNNLLESSDISRANKKALLRPLQSYFLEGKDISQGVIAAYETLAFSQNDIARFCGISRRTICRILKRHEIDGSDDNKIVR